jgi:ribosome maturation factor RimP
LFSGRTALEPVLERIREIAGRVAASEGFELVDVELHGRGPGAVVRIFLDKPGGITLEDCQSVSRQVGVLLDVEELMAARYTLEVSSPGLDRRLIHPLDFERFAGRKIKILLKNSEAGRRRFQGLLLGWEAGQVKLLTESGEALRIAPDQMERANLVPEFGGKFGERSDSSPKHSR